MKTFYSFLVLLLFQFSTLYAQLSIVTELPSNGEVSNMTASVNGKFYFTQRTEVTDKYRFDIWENDGTVNGTKLFSEQFGEGHYSNLKSLNNKLLFTKNNVDTTSLYIYNPITETLERLIDDLNYIRFFKQFNDKMVVVDADIWITDGTRNGTFKIGVSGRNIRTTAYQVVGNDLYFVAQDGLYKTDGWSNQATLIKSFDANFTNIAINEGSVINNQFYFTACDNTHGCAIWKTDGTLTGTQFVIDTDTLNNTFENNFYFYHAIGINQLNDEVIITKSHELLKTDTLFSNQNLTQIQNFYPWNNPSEILGSIEKTVKINGKLLYVISTDKYGFELWTTDGTPQGTKILNDIWENTPSGFDKTLIPNFVEFDNYLYFIANDGIHGKELWRTNGTTDGTEIVVDLAYGAANSNISRLTIAADELFFTSYFDGKFQLWKLNPDNFQAPNYVIENNENEWFQGMGSEDYSRNLDVKLDKNDNIFLMGYYRSNRFFEFHNHDDRIVWNPNVSNWNRLFISKFDKKGDLKWAKNIGDYGQEGNNAIAVDDEGNVIIAGFFHEQAGFDSTKITGWNGMYLVKYDTDGDLIWLKQGDFDGWSSVTKVETDRDGNIYISGNLGAYKATWGNISVNADVKNTNYVVKYDKSGTVQWAKSLEKELLMDNQVTGLKLNNHGDLVLLVSDGKIGNQTWCEYPTYTEVFCLNTTNGNQKWKKRFESTNLHIARSLLITDNDDILLAGEYRGILSFDDFEIEGDLSGDCYSTTGFVAILDKFGTVKRVFDDENRESKFYQIMPMKDNSYGIIGSVQYENVAQYNENWYLEKSKMFFRQYDYLGNLMAEREWFQRIGTDNLDFNPTAVVDSENYLVISNTYIGQVDTFANCYYNSWEAESQIYLMRTALDFNVDIFTTEYAADDIIIAPNPTRGILGIKSLNPEWQTYQLNIFSSNGQLLYSMNKSNENLIEYFDIRHLQNGMLFFQFDNGTKKTTKKVVKF